jgi:hypothetical protein
MWVTPLVEPARRYAIHERDKANANQQNDCKKHEVCLIALPFQPFLKTFMVLSHYLTNLARGTILSL